MPRGSVKLQFIANDSARRTTFRKRKPSIMKKMDEICTLCDTEACLIMHSQYQPDKLELWPDYEGVQHVLDRFMWIPEMEQNKKMLNQRDYIRKRISKAEKQLKKQLRENQEKHMTQVKLDCLDDISLIATLSLEDLNGVTALVAENLSDIESMLELRKSSVPPVAQQQVAVLENSDGGVAAEGQEPLVENHGSGSDGVAVEGYVPVAEDGGGYVPVIEIPGPFDGINSSTTEWLTDWFADMEEYELTSFADDRNPSGSGGAS